MSDQPDRHLGERAARVVVDAVRILGALTQRERDAVQQAVEQQLLDEELAVLVDVH